MAFLLGIDRLLQEKKLQKRLSGRRLAFLGHPASVTREGIFSLDALMERKNLKISVAFGPQHGMRGEKQDNMVESEDYTDPRHGLPVFSLYGQVRKPTPEMMETFDVLLVDLQDLGCRVYTFITTLRYLLERCAQAGKEVWILDRPNPAGRTVEGSILKEGMESFVGAGHLPMRHGLTLGELALWFSSALNLRLNLQIIEMKGYRPNASPGFGWPPDLLWVNPSPNAASVEMARCYPGTVLLEGTNLSEGRGTTHPLEMVGAPDLDIEKILKKMASSAPKWLQGCFLRPCYFEPTFQKHQGKLCRGFQIHVQSPLYDPEKFRPYRLIALFLKVLRNLHPDFGIFHTRPYEYETTRPAFDLLSGGEELRAWIGDSKAGPKDLDANLAKDERAWRKSSKSLHLYA